MIKKLEITALASSFVIIILFLILPISSQRYMIVNQECPNLIADGPCAPENIPYSQRPLIVTLTDSEELVPMKANGEIIRNLTLAAMVGVGYFYISTLESTKKIKKTTKRKSNKK